MDSPGEVIYNEGFLSKRQRGRRESRGKIFAKKNLKFQERYFILTNSHLIYKSSKEDPSVKGSFPLNRIEIIEPLPADVFPEFPYVIQVGDDDEVLYLSANNSDDRDTWIEMLQKAALKNGNCMLSWYHRGYFNQGKWSCCGGAKRECAGCKSATQFSNMEESKAKRILKADETHGQAMEERRKSVSRLVESVDGPIDESEKLALFRTATSSNDNCNKKRASSSSEDSGRGSSIPPTASPLSVQVITADKLTNQKTDGSPVNDRKTNASPVNDRKMNGSPVSEQQMNGSPGNERKTNGSPVSEQQMNGSPVNDRKVDDMLASGSREFPSLLPLASPKKSPSMSRLARLCVNQECMSDGKTALHVAIKEGNKDRVSQELDGGADIERPTEIAPRLRPLFLAFIHDHLQVMELLLKRGADPNAAHPDEHCMLIHWVASRGNLNVFKLLVKFNVDINAKTNKGDTALHIAVKNCHFSIIEALLSNECCKINAVNNRGRTALHDAAESGYLEAVQFLLSREADSLIREFEHNSIPYMVAFKSQNTTVCDMLSKCLPDERRPYEVLVVQEMAHFGAVEHVCFCGDKMVASAGNDTQISVWELLEGGIVENRSNLPMGEPVLALSSHEGTIAIGSDDIHVIDISYPQDQRLLQLLIGDQNNPPLLVASFTPEGSLIVAGTDERTSKILMLEGLSMENMANIEPKPTFNGSKDETGCVYSVTVCPSVHQPLVAVAVQPGTLFKPKNNKLIHLFNYKTSQHLHTFDTGRGGVKVSLSVAFSQDGQLLAVTCLDSLMVYLVSTGEMVHCVSFEENVYSVCFSPVDSYIAVGCARGKIKVYQTKDYQLLFEIQKQEGDVLDLSYSLKGNLLVSGGADGSIAFWKTH